MRDIWNNRYLDAEAGGAVLIDGYLYGCGYESGRTWQCLDWESGELKYSSRDLTKGSIIHADGMLYCYGENGVMALVCLFYFTKTDQAQIIRKLF